MLWLSGGTAKAFYRKWAKPGGVEMLVPDCRAAKRLPKVDRNNTALAGDQLKGAKESHLRQLNRRPSHYEENSDFGTREEL